jgi:peptidoglycan/xylan/chitin deacetylase (PgdA/CDA1 family)
MEWNHLREMHKDGFMIGSHTVTHINCAAESESVVWEELFESRKKLQVELGIRDAIFAYPYGGKEHMTPVCLDMVKKAGYVGCLSAYGGVNVGRVDPYNVLRRGIHWEFSECAMLYECLGF